MIQHKTLQLQIKLLYETLLALKSTSSTKGQALYELIAKVLADNNINLKYCVGSSTDGAANMQGQYNGFSSWMATSNPEHIHLWCYAHILNLVITDITQKPHQCTSLFGLLNGIAVFFKESHTRMDIWKESSRKVLSTIGETRWDSKFNAVLKIFGSYGDTSNALFVTIIEVLEGISKSEILNSDTRYKATSYLNSLSKYETILTANMYLRIFQHTSPTSKYLQTSGLDLITAQTMITETKNSLTAISRDFDHLKLTTDKFVEWANNELGKENDASTVIINSQLDILRIRKKKCCRVKKLQTIVLITPMKNIKLMYTM